MRSFVVANDKGQKHSVNEDKISLAEKDGFFPVVSNGEKELTAPSANLKAAEKDGFTPVYDYENAPSDLLDSAIDALPAAGATLGGVLGMAGSPIVAMAGAGVGGMAGESLKRGFRAMQGRPNEGGIVDSQAKAFIDNAAAEAGGQAFAHFAPNLLPKSIQYVEETPGATSTATNTQSQSASIAAKQAANTSVNFEGGGATVETKGSFLKPKQPQTLDEIVNWKPPANSEMVQKTRLKEIHENNPDLQNEPLAYHYSMLENPKAMKELKSKFENLPSDTSKKLAEYDLGMINESYDKAKEAVVSINGSKPKSLSDAGENFIAKIKDKYNSVNDELAPAFKGMQDNGIALTDENSKQLIQNIAAETKAGSLLKEVPIIADGQQVGSKFTLGLNSPRSGLSDTEYKAIKRVVNDLNSGISFQEIQRTREFLRKSIDPMNQAASAEIGKVRKVLLNALEEMTPADVQPVMKQYAVNQKSLENIERIIGGQIDSLDKIYAANPDKVVQKIFANPNYVKVVEDYIGPEAVNDMVASFVDKGVKSSYDAATGFSPVKLRNWLKVHQQFIGDYVEPKVAQRLYDMADNAYIAKRFMDDVNPSGTAAALKEMFDSGDFVQTLKTQGVKGAITTKLTQSTIGKLKQNQATKFVNEQLGGSTPKTKMDFSGLKPTITEADKQFATKAVAQATTLPRKDKPISRWEESGAKRLLDAGVSKEQVDKLDSKALIKASGAINNEFNQMVESLKPTKKDGAKIDFPSKVKRKGMVATVFNKNDLDEALSEGWAHVMA